MRVLQSIDGGAYLHDRIPQDGFFNPASVLNGVDSVIKFSDAVHGKSPVHSVIAGNAIGSAGR